MLTQLPWLFQLSDSDRVTSLLPVSVLRCCRPILNTFSFSPSPISLSYSQQTMLLFPSLRPSLPLLLPLTLSQEEVLLSRFLSPRPGNGFPSFGYYANRLQPRSCAEVNVIMALLPLCSSPPLHPSIIHPASIYLLIRCLPPTTPRCISSFLTFLLLVSPHFISPSHLSSFHFLLRPSPLPISPSALGGVL